jgi:membrane associated rhomboid family serine protease
MFPVSDVIPSRRTPYVTIGLIVVNAVVFLYELQLDRHEMYGLARTLGVVPAAFAWQAVPTSLFIHDGWIHFAGNMLYLWIFGDNVEDVTGRGPFLLFYLGSGSLAAMAYAGLHPGSTAPLVGASGAIAAVMGAYFVLYPRSQVLTASFLVFYLDLIEVPAIFFLGVWLLMQLVSGLASMGAQGAASGVAFDTHIVGFVMGTLVGLALRRRPRWS